MSTKFVVDGKEMELRMMFNGIDISGDFIGNTAHGMKHDAEGRYIATQADYDWWQSTIAAHQEMEAVIARYKEQFDSEEVDQVVADWSSGDLDDTPGLVILGLKAFFGN